ncbi:disease resistance protein At4g27190-like [Cryptomeria japonica]|uniref:disease resistance protein At4g27190-like n=1 Tax=Cryptomeria japonica TaxID=3369 RepID=UPI0027D9D81D|nr:disease resistance protein At4g27190-like [Cryptomeria japonica]
MGGLGKTYLLQNVYNFTKDRFEKSIWLSISQSFSISKLQHDIASHLDIKDKIHGVSEQRAEELINAHLKEKKILIVLDDVWKPVNEDNFIERLGLTIGHNFKLVITTRNKEVCRNVKAEIYEMECLSEEESWKLFCIYGFPEYEGNRAPEHLLDVARKVAKECGNLPLAIKTTAASLAGATLPRERNSKLR